LTGTTRVSLRSRVQKKKKSTKSRPRTAGGQLIFAKTKNIANKAQILKGSRDEKNTSNKKIASAAVTSSISSLLFQKKKSDDNNGGEEKYWDRDWDRDEKEEGENDCNTITPRRRKATPQSLRPNFDDDPFAAHDPTKNPKIWMPGRAQSRNDPCADHRPQSANMPSPLGRRGSLVGRAPGRFGSPSKLSGRLELLLSTLPDIENKKEESEKRGVALSWQLARNQAKQMDVTESIKELENLFDKIRQRTGIETIEKFTEVFMESEARQFTVVKQVEDLEAKLSSSVSLFCCCYCLLLFVVV